MAAPRNSNTCRDHNEPEHRGCAQEPLVAQHRLSRDRVSQQGCSSKTRGHLLTSFCCHCCCCFVAVVCNRAGFLHTSQINHKCFSGLDKNLVIFIYTRSPCVTLVVYHSCFLKFLLSFKEDKIVIRIIIILKLYLSLDAYQTTGENVSLDITLLHISSRS